MLRIFGNFVCFYVQVKVRGGRGEVGDFLTFAALMNTYFYLVITIIPWLLNVAFLSGVC